MLLRPSLRLLPVLAAIAVSACSGGSGTTSPVHSSAVTPRVESAATSGAADALAAQLLLESGTTQPSSLRPTFVPTDPRLARTLKAIALDHLRSTALGAAAGLDLVGSARTQRLAAEPDAAVDLNGDGSNLEETAAAEVARIVAFSGMALPTGIYQPVLPWSEGSAALPQPLGQGQDPVPATWRTLHPGPELVRLEHVGGFLRARALAAGVLLAQNRGLLVGATGDEGRLGLLLLQQALSSEETLLGALFVTVGGPLGGLAVPGAYNPAEGLHWLPAEVAVALDANGVPRYSATDNASDLAALASVLSGACELTWLATTEHPPTLPALFRGRPFESPPRTGPPPPQGLSWRVDIGPLMNFRCGGCHLGVGEGGFVCDTYQTVLAGSPLTRSLNLTMVVPHDHAASFLYSMVSGPPAPFEQMPLLSPLPANEIQSFADWIDQGAPENPVLPPPPPKPGEDLARVAFINLIAMHFQADTGALYHRHEGDGPSQIATATATGRALQGLAQLAGTMPDLEYRNQKPGDVLDRTATYAATALLDTEGRACTFLDLANGACGPSDDLASQAALTAGLLAAAQRLPRNDVVDVAARRAALRLLADFQDPASGMFRSTTQHQFARYTPDVLADLLAALQAAIAADMPGAAAANVRLLGKLRPVLAFSEWPGRGEVLADGLADTDGNGIPEPAAAGDANGRLPMLSGAITWGDDADAPPPDSTITWSQHIRPLFLSKCRECHMGGNQQGNYRLDTLQSTESPAEVHGDWPLVVPGDPEHSLLYRKLTDRSPPFGGQMPLQRTPLNDTARAMVRRWIQDGASAR